MDMNLNYCSPMEDDVYIILNDFNTKNADMRVLELGSKQPSKLRYEKSQAYGQDGYTKVSEGAYEGFIRTSRILVNDYETYKRFMSDFYAGQDVKVRYSDDNNDYRLGTISDILDDIIIGDNRQLTISIDLQPFLYRDTVTISVTNNRAIRNEGGVYTYPLIRAYGNGLGRINVGDCSMELDVDEMVIIDCEGVDVFDKNGVRANSRRKSGDFPRIDTGNTTLSVSGAITKMELDVNWRWR